MQVTVYYMCSHDASHGSKGRRLPERDCLDELACIHSVVNFTAERHDIRVDGGTEGEQEGVREEEWERQRHGNGRINACSSLDSCEK